MSLSTFSEREIQLIIESLLYCASVDLDHSQYQEDVVDMAQLAIKLRLKHQNISTKNIIFVKDTPFTDPLTKVVLNFFPEL
jgi:hypothetical protein